VSRDQAKVLNYARIYGAGEQFARLLLKQFNPALSEGEVSARARHMYEQTKGLRGYKLNARGAWLHDLLFCGHEENEKEPYHGEMITKKMMNALTKKMVFLNRLVAESREVRVRGKVILCHQLTEEGRQLYDQLVVGREGGGGGCTDLLLDNERLKEFARLVEEVHGNEARSDFDVLNTLGRSRNMVFPVLKSTRQILRTLQNIVLTSRRHPVLLSFCLFCFPPFEFFTKISLPVHFSVLVSIW
jgi:hypothetical protein